MLAQERFERILEILREKQSVTVVELTEKLNTSESTIRRDLTELNRQGLLIKVHGGATAIKSVLSREEEVITKSKKHQEEKRKIAKYAASLINKEDIVYLDAGTTTEMMLDYLREYDVIYVTNGITHARKLMNAGFKVHLIGGEIKAVTEALVGEEALEQLDKYNFTKGFFGTNGIDLKRGFTTPDHLPVGGLAKGDHGGHKGIVGAQLEGDDIGALDVVDELRVIVLAAGEGRYVPA